MVAKRSGDFCGAIGCSNSRYKCPGKSFFKFPRDEQRCREWIQRTHREDLLGRTVAQIQSAGVRLCADHFEPSQFNRPYARDRLVWNALPSIFMNVPKRPQVPRKKRAKILGKMETRSAASSEACGHHSESTTAGANLELDNATGMGIHSSDQQPHVKLEPDIKIEPGIGLYQSYDTHCDDNQTESCTNRCSPTEPSTRVSRRLSGVKLVNSGASWVKFDGTVSVKSEAQENDDCLEPGTNTISRRLIRAGSTYQLPDERAIDDKTSAHEGIKSEAQDLKPGTNTISERPSSASSASQSPAECVNDDNILVHGGIKSEAQECDDHLEAGTNIVGRKLVSASSTLQSPAECDNDDKTFVDKGSKAEAQDFSNSDAGSRFYQESCTVLYANGQMVCDIKFEPVDHHEEDTGGPEAASTQLSEECSGDGLVNTETQQCENSGEIGFGINRKCGGQQDSATQTSRSMDKLPIVCPHCGMEFKQRWKFKRHVLFHLERAHACTECDAKFVQASDLKRHILKHTGEKPVECSLCESRFSQIGQLKRHMVTHTGVKAFECTECGAKLASANSLKNHMRIHSGHRPYQCTQCDLKFGRAHHLKRHMQTHVVPSEKPPPEAVSRPHVCGVCSACFTQAGSLKTHMMRHTGEKPYSCTQCEQQFTRSNSLKRHMLKHTGQRPYQCGQCGSTFVQSAHLTAHMLTHSSDRPHQCSECDKRFGTIYTLRSHMRTHSGGKKQECPVCGLKLAWSSSMNKHMLTHSDKDNSKFDPKKLRSQKCAGKKRTAAAKR